MSALSDLLNEARGDLSVREVGRRVAKHGVGESPVIPYFNGKHGTPSEVTRAHYIERSSEAADRSATLDGLAPLRALPSTGST